ncbi:unnamed protein product [Lactuca saligna]|uniref:Uncharacterized protein n=1 Tax=Lactuca saligna TaxID=75948 RepID=A0AA35ZU46_LACSI|nr:unnamed protein product [Lactuca saligna]
MDQLAEKAQKAKVLSIKLQYTNKHMDDLKSEKTIIKICVSEINQTFLFRCFDKVEKALISDKAVNLKLFNFQLKYAKPQYQTWSLKKIIRLKVCSAVPTEDFTNIRFKGFWGTDKVLDEFTLTDFPFMNPFDWVFLFNIILKDEKKYEPIVAHLKRMFICYIQEIAKIDVEIAIVLKKMPLMKLEEESSDLPKQRLEVIQKEHYSSSM